MKRPNEYDAVLQALTSPDLRRVSAQLQAVEANRATLCVVVPDVTGIRRLWLWAPHS